MRRPCIQLARFALCITSWVVLSSAATGQSISPERGIDDHGNRMTYNPSVAYNSDRDEYLVVWHNVWPSQPGFAQRDVYGVFLDRYGKSISGLLWLSPSPVGDALDRSQPAVAYDPDHQRYLLVYVKDILGDGSDWDVYGRFLSWDGTLTTYPELAIGYRSRNEWSPRLALSPNSDSFLVTWEEEGDVLSVYKSVRGAHVDSATMTAGSSATLADHASADRLNPDVAWDPWANRFLIVYDDNHDVFAKTVPASTLTPLGPERTVAAWADNETNATLATCGEHRFLVGWQSLKSSTQHDITLRFVDNDGTIGGTSFYDPFGISQTAIHEENVRLDCTENTSYLVVWRQQYSNLSGPFGLSGAEVKWTGEIQPHFDIRGVDIGESGVTTHPAVAAGKVGWMVAWEHLRQGTSYLDIYGRAVYRLFADGFEDGVLPWYGVLP